MENKLVKLEEAFDEINPKATILRECKNLSNQIDTIIDETLPSLKKRLEAMLSSGKDISIISVDVESEIQTKIDRAIKTIAGEKTIVGEKAKAEEIIAEEIIK